MLNPCQPCVCSGAPCEQCMFGYTSNEERHRRILDLLLDFKAGKKAIIGWKCAENFIHYHPDWEKEIEKEKKADMVTNKENPCKSCIHSSVCGNKDKFLSIIDEVDNGGLAEYKDIPWIKFTLTCTYFKYK